jgi:hypothetical protein
MRDAEQLATETQLLFGSGLTGNLSGLMTNATAFNRAESGDAWPDALRKAITRSR